MNQGPPLNRMEIAAALAALGIDDPATVMRIQIWPNGSAVYPAKVVIVRTESQGHTISSSVEHRDIEG